MKIRPTKKLQKLSKDDLNFPTILREFFGSSSEKVPFFRSRPEADPKVIRRRPEESTLETRQIPSKCVKSRHSFHKTSIACGFIKG
ncbi:hypothetical protein [Chryseobacterium taeanense]|uniref:hypothetical protein n=1 Tax=Chryseobacterium taeanense TaxID=311334 RepID=UPI000B7D28C8|nr:hypothetical protein [Chryseobacterium taeanense]